MTVKDVFELRKQGKIEEAYNEIKIMYASHKGKYTTLAMFWTAHDILKKRLEEKKTDEAQKIFLALLRIKPNVDDSDGSANNALIHSAIAIKDHVKGFRIIDIIEKIDFDSMPKNCWKSITTQQGNLIPSYAQQLLTRLFHEIKQQPTVDNALVAMPLLQTALAHNPYHKNNKRFMALIYVVMNEKEKAITIYKELLKRYHDSYLYDELADLIDDKGMKAALTCMAIMNQKQEKFRSKYHLKLANLLVGRDNRKAKYELEKCLIIRKKQNLKESENIKSLQKMLEKENAVSYNEQQHFYKMMTEKYL